MFFAVLCLLCLCVRLFICALWPPARKGLTSCLWCLNFEFVTYLLVWYLIVSFPDLCTLIYLVYFLIIGDPRGDNLMMGIMFRNC